MSVVLIGPPGAGKSTVGGLVAQRLGVPFCDTDDAVEAAAGRSISDIFVQDGESAFRALERSAVVRALAGEDRVVSLGGGAVMQPEVAEVLRDGRHRVVFLDVTIADAASRVGFDTSRPLLLVNPRAAWTRLMNARRPTYEGLAGVVVHTGGRTVEQVADEVLAAVGGAGVSRAPSRTIEVRGEPGYAVHVGPGALGRLTEHGRPGRRVLVVAQPGREALVRAAAAGLEGTGARVVTATVPDAEAAKTAQVLAGLWSTLGREGFTRDDLVVGVGGGAVTDLAGFAAATWLRGVDAVLLPTSLLGVVDAAVGGKTGINTAEGKNLVGAFHPPRAVLCDPAWLAGMTRGDYVSGLAEVLKCGFIADPVILDLVEAAPHLAVDPTADPVLAVELIARAVQVKADVVGADLREASLREILNYGHTFAHAVELAEDYSWRHGDAVAVGMVFVAELAHRAGLIDNALLERHRGVLGAVGLPTSYPAGAQRWGELRTAMARDKKSRGDTLRLVVLEGLARPTRLEAPDEDLLLAAHAAVS